MTRPPSAGPTTCADRSSRAFSAAVAGRSDTGTSAGMSARRVVASTPDRPPAKAATTKSGHSAGPAKALMASAALSTASMIWVTSITRRRSMASAYAPPSSDSTMSGPSSARLMSPTISDDPVMVNTWYGNATSVIWLPMSDTDCPAISSLRSRDLRRGLRSARTRAATRATYRRRRWHTPW